MMGMKTVTVTKTEIWTKEMEDKTKPTQPIFSLVFSSGFASSAARGNHQTEVLGNELNIGGEVTRMVGGRLGEVGREGGKRGVNGRLRMEKV